MFYDVSKILTDFDEVPIEEIQVDENNKPDGKKTLTVGDVMISVLMNLSKNEETLTGDKKLGRYTLSMRIKRAIDTDGKANLGVDDVGLIKKLVGEKSAPVVVGKIWPFLENEGQSNTGPSKNP